MDYIDQNFMFCDLPEISIITLLVLIISIVFFINYKIVTGKNIYKIGEKVSGEIIKQGSLNEYSKFLILKHKLVQVNRSYLCWKMTMNFNLNLMKLVYMN